MPSIIAAVSDVGRTRLTDLMINGRGFIINKYVLGNGGHDPADPTKALTPDVTVTSLPGLRFGPDAIDSGAFVGLYCPQFHIVVLPTEAVGEISNVGLMGTITYVPAGITPSPAVGSTFLFAIGNMPLSVKTSVTDLVLDVGIQF